MPPKFEIALGLHNPPIPFETKGLITIVYEYSNTDDNLHRWGFEDANQLRDYLLTTAEETDARLVAGEENYYEFGPKIKST